MAMCVFFEIGRARDARIVGSRFVIGWWLRSQLQDQLKLRSLKYKYAFIAPDPCDAYSSVETELEPSTPGRHGARRQFEWRFR